MTSKDQDDERFVRAVDIDGRTYNVTVRVGFDGIEYVGHLWFLDADWDDDDGIRDHGSLPGRSADEILEHARALEPQELAMRHRRALSERRRYHGLRQATQEVLTQIRYLNRVATSMRAGLLDLEEAAAEITGTEKRLHEMVDRLRLFAGVAS